MPCVSESGCSQHLPIFFDLGDVISVFALWYCDFTLDKLYHGVLHGEESLQPKKAKIILRGKKHASSTGIRMRLTEDIYHNSRQL